MLDNKVFLQGINYLKANYLNWQFDINNDLSIKVWYKKFSNLDAAEFMALIEKYTNESKYAPNNPTDILGLIKTAFAGGAQAWEWVLSLAQQYPLDNEYQKPKFFQELQKDKLAYKLFEMLEVEALLTNDNQEQSIFNVGSITYMGFGGSYRKDKFIKWYDAEKAPKQLLQIGVTNNLLSM